MLIVLFMDFSKDGAFLLTALFFSAKCLFPLHDPEKNRRAAFSLRGRRGIFGPLFFPPRQFEASILDALRFACVSHNLDLSKAMRSFAPFAPSGSAILPFFSPSLTGYISSFHSKLILLWDFPSSDNVRLLTPLGPSSQLEFSSPLAVRAA